MYYALRTSTDENVIGGAWPQANCITQAAAHSLTSWKFPSSTPKLIFELDKKAKLTDVLSKAAISARGFILNQKVREVLAHFKLMEHQYYPCTIVKKKENLPYFWLHLSQIELSRQIDYKKSIIFETEYTFPTEQIQIDSFEDYQKRKSEDKDASFGIEFETIALSDQFNRNLDLFTFTPFTSDVYISENLRDVLMTNQITGLEIEPAKGFNY